MYFQILNILQCDDLCPQKIQGKLSSSLASGEVAPASCRPDLVLLLGLLTDCRLNCRI